MRQRILFLSASACLALSSVGLATAAADAADIPDPITSLEVTGQAQAPGDVLTLAASWQAPDGSAAGDSFALPLPAGLVPMSTDFPLTNEAGDVVATAHVERGVVTVVLTDFVTTHPLGIHGSIRLQARVTQEAQAGGTITVTWGGQTKTIAVGGGGTGTPVPAPLKASKRMWQSGSVVRSAIAIPGEITHPVVEDTPSNLSIVCSSVKLALGTEVEGQTPTAWTPLAPVTSTCDPSGMMLVLPDIPAGELAQLTYDSTPAPGTTEAVNAFTVTGTQYHAGGTVKKTLYQGNGSADGQSPSPIPTETTLPSETPSTTPTGESTTPPATTSETPAPTESTPSTGTPTPAPSTTPTEESTTPPATTGETGTPAPTETSPTAETPSTTPTEESTTPPTTTSETVTPSSSAAESSGPSVSATGPAERTTGSSASGSSAPAMVPAAGEHRGGGGSGASSSEGSSSPSLASTGANVVGWGLSGLGAVVAGTVLVSLRRRRRA